MIQKKIIFRRIQSYDKVIFQNIIFKK